MNRSFWITALIAFANSLSFTILIPILYLYGRQFGLTDFQTSLLFSIYAIAQFFATPVIGKLSDRFGRKPLLILSLAGTVLANFLAGTATTVALLFFARFLDGITGGNASVAQAVISDVTTPENRAKGFGIYGATFGLGFVLGPAISLLAQQISLGAGFLVSSAIAAIALFITIFFLPETLKTQPQGDHKIFDLGLSSLITGLAIPKIGIGQDSKALTLMFFAFGVLGVIMQLQGIKILTRKFSLVKIFLFAVFVRSLSFTLMPIVPNVVYFVCVSIVFSIFNSLVQPMLTTLISLNAKPEEQGTVIGLNSSYLNVSNAFGPILAGLLVNQNNPATYSYPLYVAGALTFLVLLFAIAKRKEYTPG
jgi:predicted MFS family arabinose efflux permease